MATYPEHTIRFPPSLSLDVRIAAEREGVSLDSFIVQAVAEKVATLRARGLADPLTPEEQTAYLAARAARATLGAFERLVRMAGTTSEVLPGDELPDDWNAEPVAPETGGVPGNAATEDSTGHGTR